MKRSRGTQKPAKTVTWRGPRVRLAVATLAVAAIAPVAMLVSTATAQTLPGDGGIKPTGTSWNSVVHVHPIGSSWNETVRLPSHGSSWN